MQTESKLFNFLAVFMLPLGIVYWIVSKEPLGTILLAITAVAFALVGCYLYLQSKRLGGPRPEDYDATQEDGAGEVGSFPVASIWPFVGAMGMTVMSFGLVFNGFLAIPGATLMAAAVFGMARESSASEHGPSLEELAHPEADAAPNFSDQVKK